ncbi:hypothetical protein BFU36_07895 [Sulfolobus sp. A20]|uniref:circularly permuted type 2 ATP-grasp protein n=1 Tax=Saccharolobus sp. A20 TaxID=1891280 RepID=UPI000845EA63|nr:circularly permuted type 2 ATP-grasp protein [Sulfolobus sp. A20]TRM75799.1 hypothetical protein DJ532_09220 [Sulfolobus sp. A20-N-F8]TRM75912.1 hypothetical protein DJ523_02065 [Sulfolobus sp. E5]TRM78609.1 hypothetical protein DJ528_04510 [Sulfolobus sp. B5]TRM83800.1 hypothetical protein DJ531_03770 [Sulfolobus sp. A20-N-F6]TRM88189.1 hypothetical protein DJ521_02355 [Sulfolobus sp. E3]TRM89693.1 hypothetical protein DJ529_01070 [Sulfolobus sp. C3]TRN01716.1 hypothetical protein DJ530_
MIKPRKMSEARSFFEYDEPYYSSLIDKIGKISNFFEYVDLINELAYKEGFTFYTQTYFRSIKIDPIPRILRYQEFREISNGLKNRALAINKFLYATYHGEDTPVPKSIITSSPYFRPEMMDFDPPKGIYVYIFGEDIVKVNGLPLILEDNVRIPSGMSYAIKASELVNRILGKTISIPKQEDDGLILLRKTLKYASDTRDPVIAILTDGTLNSAYFEHKFYSDNLDLLLIEPSDLVIKDGEVVAKTLDGEIHIDVIYRRIEDLDVLTPGLMKAYLRGWVNIVNAPGTGIADDKITFCYMPQIMDYFGIKEGVRQPFSIPLGASKEDVINKVENMVLKRREGYGGSGTFVIKDLREEDKMKILREVLSYPEEFMAQELLNFDTVLSAINDNFYETYADLRFFVFIDVASNTILSRVAPLGSRVTNNSSGGLVKPVWVV